MTSNGLRWRWWWLRPQFRDEPQNRLEHLPWDGDREINFRTPALLKIGVQGAELIVLRGASVALRSCELVLLETSFNL